MANRHRGEIEAELSGKSYTLCLTLGALAEIEHAYGGEDMIAIAERFETGRISATDAIRVIGAGLRGAGNVITDKDVAAMTVAGGAAGFLDIVVRLLKATFVAPEANPGNG
ncbi:MAG TPA: gene transfer agent family protein [Aestuariivirga sp.]|mgnify:CR=1 FL=1|nr:gene transfer agent family protein [Aestuariivirga sp.]